MRYPCLISWTTLPDFIFPFYLPVAPYHSKSESTVPWSGIELPEAPYIPARKISDPTLIDRLREGLRRGIKDMERERASFPTRAFLMK